MLAAFRKHKRVIAEVSYHRTFYRFGAPKGRPSIARGGAERNPWNTPTTNLTSPNGAADTWLTRVVVSFLPSPLPSQALPGNPTAFSSNPPAPPPPGPHHRADTASLFAC